MTDDELEARALARRARWLSGVEIMVGFDASPDHAAMITRFFRASRDRYSEDHFDPLLGPILKQSRTRYGEVRRFDFTLANHVAMTEGVRAILALPLEKTDADPAEPPT